ncbi:MAG: hypothetical protein EBV06_05330 [Planctomycetia bacterium]|nr:hypothetical protein [Planctomycetia bacterium]
MRHMMLLVVVLGLGGCKSFQSAGAIKEKPIADPLLTSKKPSVWSNRVAVPTAGESVPIPQPPPMLSEPPRPDASIRLTGMNKR